MHLPAHGFSISWVPKCRRLRFVGPSRVWEYDAPAGVTIPAPSTTGSTTTFTLQKNPWGSETVEIVFRTKAGVTQIEHFFMMNFDVTTSVDWAGFQVKLIDKFDAVGPPPQGAS